jgi:hypothetical protein
MIQIEAFVPSIFSVMVIARRSRGILGNGSNSILIS